MRKILIITVLLISVSTINSQILKDVWNQTKEAATSTATSVAQQATTAVNSAIGGTTAPALSNDEVIKGLREALSIGTNNSSGSASKMDGYLKNARLFIPWPEEAKDMREKLIKLGMQKKVEEFETSLNRAAEEAAKKAGSVFLDAITKMSVSDGFAILKGADTAATNFLRKTSYSPLYSQFLPIVKEAIAKKDAEDIKKKLVDAGAEVDIK